MRKLLYITVVTFLVNLLPHTSKSQASYISKDNYTGFWKDASTWTKTQSGLSDTVNTTGNVQYTADIYGYVTRQGNLTIGSSSLVTLFDTLWVKGNLKVDGTAELHMEQNAVLIVDGNLESSNKGAIYNWGARVIVKNNLITNTDGIIINNRSFAGPFYVFNSISGDGTGFAWGLFYNADDLAMYDLPLMEFANITTLPIELLYFRAHTEALQVNLSWATAMEENFDYFTVERAGQDMHFQAIGTVQGKGFSSTTVTYDFQDNTPLSGKAYYRLKATDYDGSEAYHQTISVYTVTQNEPARVFPNPVSQDRTLNIATNDNAFTSVSLLDFLGNVLFKTALIPGSNQYQLPENIKAGTYILILAGENGINQKVHLVVGI